MAVQTPPRINLQRLRDFLAGINRFGREINDGGYSRPAFSEADMAARYWLRHEMLADGLRAEIDTAGNVRGWWDVGNATGEGAVAVGSHTDTVVRGGAFDGALGVAVGMECVRALREAGVVPTRPVVIISTADEEGRFGGMLGSQTLAGLADPEWLESAIDAEGIRLWDAMTATGFDPARVPEAALPSGSVRAFLELHIEQGPLLERTGIPVGLVDVISGVCNWTVRLHGVANHAGSTPMSMRADAFAGLAELATTIPDVISAAGTDHSKITIGRVALTPNTPHTIPGAAEFSVIFKDSDEATMKRLTEAFSARLRETASAHHLTYDIDVQSWLPPVTLDGELRSRIEAEADRLEIETAVMPSGGGHDAQTMTALCPTALVFVPSKGGISHAPGEDTDWDDIAIGATLMLATLHTLSTT